MNVLNSIAAELSAYIAMFIACLLLASAIHKVLSRKRLIQSVADLTGLPDTITGPTLALAGFAELAAALAMLFPASVPWGAMVAGSIWSIYLVLILLAKRDNQKSIDCGCSFGSKHGELGNFELVRNVLLVFFALVLAAACLLTSMTVSIGATHILGGLAFLAIYASIDQLASVTPGANR